MSSSPFWFGPPTAPLFGWLAVPSGYRARGGVVICPAVGDEGRRTHRTLRSLAEKLEEAGFVVLRFDHMGTGDSAGSLSDIDGTTTWIAGVQAAVDVVRNTGTGFVGGVGMRLGSTILSQAVARGQVSFDALVLWDPCLSGRDFLREQQILQASLVSHPISDDTGQETPGYLFPGHLAEDLRRFEMAVLRSGDGLPERTLVLTRPERRSSKLRTRLPDPTVEWATAEGQPALLDVPPLSSVVPTATVSLISGWLSSIAPSNDRPLHPVRGSNTMTMVDHDGQVITERIVELPPIGLFGITTEPNHAAHGPWIIFLNVATEHHIGPGRAWVDLSRAWAARGLRSLRFDLSGIGDSPAHDGEASDVNYARQWLDDVPAVIRSISPEDPSNVVLIGLCSGGYSALEAGISVHARAVCTINVGLSSFSLNRDSPVFDARRRAFRPVPVPLARLGRKHGRIAWAIWHACCQVVPGQAPMAVAAAAVRAGIELNMLSGPDDLTPLLQGLYWRLIGMRQLQRSGRFRLMELTDADHPLLGYLGREQAKRLLTERIVSRYVGDGMDRLANRVAPTSTAGTA
jgi:alpha-beta hydrolase superfamily lysophospholipase